MEKRDVSKKIEDYSAINYKFTDYPYFEGEISERLPEMDEFKVDKKYAPEYIYKKLKNIQDNISLSEKKSTITEAILELEQLKKEPGVNDVEVQLYIETFENRLKKINLVEAAAILNGLGPVDSDYKTATESYLFLNKEIYGEFNSDIFLGMMATEKAVLENFHAKIDIEKEIKADLTKYFDSLNIGGHEEQKLLDDVELERLHSFILGRYHDILAVVPNTSQKYYYDAKECQKIMQDALYAGGLSQLGWKILLSSTKANVATSTENKTITLPVNTKRNAAELRRLILHEQEVHARRGANGTDSGFELLASGTSNYADSEEGLGVLLECALEGNFDNASYDRARYRYITAGLALGVGDSPRDARSTYEILWRLISINDSRGSEIDNTKVKKSKEFAYSLVENAFRSTDFTTKGVIYLKLKIYYEGLKKNADFIKEHLGSLDDTFDLIMLGKYNHTDEAETKNILSVIKNRSFSTE